MLSPADNAAARAARFARFTPTGVAFNGTSLNIDYAAYLAQHDLVYLTPPTKSAQALPLGDGDLGAMLWCPGPFQLQVQKSDLWADPTAKTRSGAPAPASTWRQLSAGAVSLYGVPALFDAPDRFEQRLSLYSGTMSLRSDTEQGSCQATAFAAATAGVLVLHYQDQSLRNTERRIEVSLWRDAYLFALGETIGILQSLPDRRCALMARVAGKRASARMKDAHTAVLEIEPFRSGHFTLYVTVATSPKMGDPITAAKTRIEDAMAKGHELLLREHKQHWAQFWQKSFLRLSGPSYDPLPGYLENLWYHTLYTLASCARGFDAPLPNGATWLHDGDARNGPALYTGPALRAMTAPLLPANHLELTVPFLETYHRLLPDMVAQTGSQFGVGGARFPERFNRHGDAFDVPDAPPFVSPEETTAEVTASEETAESEASLALPDLDFSDPAAPRTRINAVDCGSLGDGLAMALFFWDAWRYAPEALLLRQRAYPLLRACTVFALEYAIAHPQALREPTAHAQLATALRTLLWASAELGLDADQRPDWEIGWRLLEEQIPATPLTDTPPFGTLTAANAVECLQARIDETPQLAQGFFAPDGRTPDLRFAGQLGADLAALLLREEQRLPEADESAETVETPSGGVESILRVFPALPSTWSATFTLAAPGGFRVSAEATGAMPSYVAVHSLFGGICRLANPWGAGFPVRILDGREIVAESAEAVLTFETQPGHIYAIEREDFSLARAVRVRLDGRRNDRPKKCGNRMLGLNAA